jgi:uncharacterized repeat protein (TIGR03806 family)
VEKAYAGLSWERPIYLKQEPKTNNLVVAEAEGRIVLIEASGDADDYGRTEKRELAYFRDRIIYGFEFHPDYGKNGWVYLFSNSGRGVPNAKNRISRISVTRENGNAVEWPRDSEVLLLEWNSAGHDGGDLLFGKDGKLYISTGDGSSDSDDWMSAQDVTNLLGSILRIDVDRPSENLQYSVPADNPFVDIPNARKELWAIGLRNPWRMSMDQKTGDIWIGNNGQDLWESVHLLGRGFNYGWSVYEGSHPFYTNRPLGPGILTTPTIEHHHREARSLTGGVVYRGKQFPELNGAYVYGDHETGKIWAAKYDGKSIEWRREIASTTLKIVCFANDSQGELLIVDYHRGIYRLASNKIPKNSSAKTRFPRRLSETGLYESVSDRKTADGVVPYSINAQAWHDGAQSERFFALPENGRIEYRSYRSWRFPEGAILGQTLYLPVDLGSQRREKVLETRLLVKQQGDEWAGYTYMWNKDQKDATLVDADGDRIALGTYFGDDTRGDRSWSVPSRADCISCHNRIIEFTLSATELQMNRPISFGWFEGNQIELFSSLGVFSNPKSIPMGKLKRLPSHHDEKVPIALRAKSYLHVNCAHCHVYAGGGNSRMELEFEKDVSEMGVIGNFPQHGSLGLGNALVVNPGDSTHSVLVERLRRRGNGQMPPIASEFMDPQGVQLMRDWIDSMKPARSFVKKWTVAELTPKLTGLQSDQPNEAGRRVFQEIGCANCHKMHEGVSGIGPNLGDISKRLTPIEVLESVIMPSKNIPDAYQATVVQTSAGETFEGRVISERDGVLSMIEKGTNGNRIQIPISEISKRLKSSTSTMPEGTLDQLQLEEILDLMRYLLSSAD